MMDTIETILDNEDILLKEEHVDLLIKSEQILLKDNLVYLTKEYIYYLFGDKNRRKGIYKDPKILRIPLSAILMNTELDIVMQKNFKTNRYCLAINCEGRWLYFIFTSSLD